MPAPPYSLHQPALHGERTANIGGCCFAARPESAGSSAAVVLLQGLCRSNRPPAVFACSGPVLPALLACHLCHVMPTALLISLPRSFCFAPCSFHVRQDRRRELYRLSRWQLQHGPAEAARAPGFDSDSSSFSCRVHDPGPWFSVKFVRC